MHPISNYTTLNIYILLRLAPMHGIAKTITHHIIAIRRKALLERLRNAIFGHLCYSKYLTVSHPRTGSNYLLYGLATSKAGTGDVGPVLQGRCDGLQQQEARHHHWQGRPEQPHLGVSDDAAGRDRCPDALRSSP